MATTATWFAGLLGAIFANGVSVETSGGLNFKAPFTVTPNEATGVLDIDVSLAGSPISQIQSEGVNVAQRTKLNFKGFTITDDAGNDRTNVALTTSDPTSTGQIVTWSNALGKWVAGRTMTGAYSVIGDVSITSFLAVGTTPPVSGAMRVGGDIVATGFAALSGAGSYVAVGASPATTGAGRFTNAEALYWQNGAANVRGILGFNGDIFVGDDGATGPGTIYLRCNTTLQVQVNALTQLVIDETTADFQNNNIVTTGHLHLGNGSIVTLDSSPGGSAIWALRTDTGENLYLGASSTGTNANVVYQTPGVHQFEVSGNAEVVISANVLNFNASQNADFSIQGNGEAMIGLNIAASGVRNLDLFGDGSADMNDGDGTIAIRECVAVPSGASSTGDTGQLFNENGELKWLAPNGNVTTLAGL